MAKKKNSEKQSKNKKNKQIKKQNSTYFLIATILLLMLITYFYFTDNFTNEKTEEKNYDVYNGFEFTKSNINENLWTTEIKIGGVDRKIEVWYHPLDLENISYDSDLNQYLFLSQSAEGEAYISLSEELTKNQSPQLSLAGYDIGRLMRSFLGFQITVLSENETDLWMMCEDANITNFVIELNKGPMRIEAEPYCAKIFIDDTTKATKVSSLLMYKLLGIM